MVILFYFGRAPTPPGGTTRGSFSSRGLVVVLYSRGAVVTPRSSGSFLP